MERKLRRCKKVTRKHATLKPEDYSDPEEEMARQRSEIVSSVREQAKDQKRKKQTRERWLLTRKTWRYMADAGRRLIPEGAQNRVEDIPKLEAYFQEVCQKEKRFLLWRKSSYPGALNFRVHRKKQRERKKWSSCREKASSADEAEQQKRLFEVETKSGGRFDIQKLRQQFLDSGPPASQTGDEFAMRYKALKPIPDQTRYLPDVPEYSATQQEDVSLEDDERELMDTLLYLLSREQDGAPVETNEDERKALDYAKLFYQLKRYLSQSNSGDGQTASDSARDMYKTTTTDFEKESPGANSRSREYPVSEISTRSDISLKNRKGLHTDGYEENREAVTLRSTPRSTKDDNYQYGYERVNLRRNANSVSSSTDDTKDDTNLKSRGEFQSGSQPRSGFMYRLGKTNSDVHPRTTHNHSPVSGQQTSPGPSSRRIPRTGSGNVYFEGDHLRKLLIETLRRYYNKSDSRDKVISDILTDRKVLEKLYFDLRKARNFKGRSGPTDGQDTDRHNWKTSTDKMYEVRNEGGRYGHDESLNRGWKGSEKTMAKRPCDLPLYTKPPIIAVEQEAGARWASKTIQTLPVPEEVMAAIEEFSKREKEKALEEKEEKEDNELKPPPVVTRRRSSVDHDDVSPSVSDTIKRYLKMARKKSVDADKVDRFKRVNYDRNLRNIKPKGEISRPGDDDGLSKGCQTEETWVAALKELKQDDIGLLSEEDDYQRSRMTSCRSSFDSTTYDEALLSPPSPVHGKAHSPGLLSSGQSFLSHLLHGRHHHDVSQPGSPVAAGAAMQKSKSSSSVVHHGSRIVARKIWRTRSKSQSRAVPSVTSTWTPQGRCTWSNVTDAQVTLTDTNLVQLTDLERRVLQKVALAKLQALNLGVTVRVPSETLAADTPHKPKRRPHLLKRKALTTSFFDTVAGKGADKDKDGGGGGGVGLVFGIPISQCLENDRLARGAQGSDSDQSRLRRKSHHGSRSSCTSLTDTAPSEQAGSCDSLDLVAGSVPGLLNALSSELEGLEQREPGVPSLVSSCCQHLEAHGLNTLGIFRVSSSKKRVRQLREVFDSGKETQLDDDVCPHDVATLLKEFFRDLPEPLLCRDLYHAFLQMQRIRNRRLQFEALQHLVQQLPVPNRDTLWALLAFLSKVARHAPDYINEKGESVAGNKMDSGNLATLFAPNILHGIRPGSTKDVSTETSEERMEAISVVRAMIDHHDQLFTVSAELLDEVYLHMMDSHPEALDYLLRRRGLLADKSMDDLESGVLGETSLLEDDGLELERGAARRVWSREEFLHESAGTGGPDVSMRPRHKERQHSRVRYSKKHWWEDAPKTAGSDADGASSDTGSSVGSSHLAVVPKDVFGSASRLDDDSSRRKSTPVLLDSGGSVITASLKIPAPFSRDDADIAFVEDAAAHRQVTVGVVRPTTRQRLVSTSGSDSSSALASPGLQEAPRTVSPPNSVSPPPSSWASSPPNSPDGTVTSVDYLPEPRQQRPVVAITAKEITPVILHKVTFASSAGGEQRMQLLSQDLPKSASTSAIQREQPAPASISSIGGAVMRSKTADIERILRIHKPAERVVPVVVERDAPTPAPTPTSADANKYSKRRYTESRHQTRHIPDCEALEAGGGSAAASSQPQVPVYKRRELIASDPKDHETFL